MIDDTIYIVDNMTLLNKGKIPYIYPQHKICEGSLSSCNLNRLVNLLPYDPSQVNDVITTTSLLKH